jgi:glucose-6-phosphate 1-dehydrogenase
LTFTVLDYWVCPAGWRVLWRRDAGDASLFAWEDYVEEAWRIVDPALKAGTPMHEYERRPGDRKPLQESSLRVAGATQS